MSSREVIKRHQFADYLNVGTSENANFVLMGTGFKKIDEEPGAKSESVQYVNEKSASSEVVGYETKFPFEADQIADQEAISDLYNIGRNHYVGIDAQREFVRVELWKTPTQTNTYEARKFIVSAEISSFAGETKMGISGNLNAIGDPILGTFNTVTKTFTAAADAVAGE